MKYHGVYTSRFPIRLWFAGVCPVCRLAHAGLDLSVALTPGCFGYPIVAALIYPDEAWLNFTRFSVDCQGA